MDCPGGFVTGADPQAHRTTEPRTRWPWLVVSAAALATVVALGTWHLVTGDHRDCSGYAPQLRTLYAQVTSDQQTERARQTPHDTTIRDARILFHYVLRSPCSSDLDKAKAQAQLDALYTP